MKLTLELGKTLTPTEKTILRIILDENIKNTTPSSTLQKPILNKKTVPQATKPKKQMHEQRLSTLVVDFLKNNSDRPYGSKEIAKALNHKNIDSINATLYTLRKLDIVDWSNTKPRLYFLTRNNQ